jgi:riboflavin-specific deaminase-like protein
LRALAARPPGQALVRGRGLRLDSSSELEEVQPELGWVCLDRDGQTQVGLEGKKLPAVAQMLELYLPLCLANGGGSTVFGHLGQSLDGQIATRSGASRYVSGPENLRHMHHLRALCDAVIVGASTVEQDDPQLTTRLVPGPSPTRVVIDPTLRLPAERQVFQDRAARTLIVCARGRSNGHRFGEAELCEVDAEDGVMPPAAIVAALHERGLKRLFVEGGGVTISRFLAARALDRLHITICPLFIGKGRPGILLPPIEELGQALRPRTRRFSLGDDVLFDCDIVCS